ncbi:MAG: hypothetical protein DMG68_07595 [Acidobacteria bacterium]|nr:MAG: hypothetical protein DMG68_07595 [Acidobacteriota bacterium]
MKLLHVEQLGVGREGAAIKGVVAENYEIYPQLLRDAVRRGARKMEINRNTELVVGANAVLATQDV